MTKPTLAVALVALAGALLVPSDAQHADPRVRAFLKAYGALIDSVTYAGEDIVFVMGSRPIHFHDGRMLGEGEGARADECDPIFYEYPLEALVELPPPPPDEGPTYCTDVLESLWGRTEAQIRAHGRSTTFFDKRMFVNELLIEPLASVERDISAASEADAAVAGWVDELQITYSFMSRRIAGSSTRSQHAWGMAVDFVPSSYEGRQVYWRWSRVFDRQGWHQIPLERRWSPPQAVIEIFERHGFVWGGKWAHFDNIHFEYRPEILLYNELIADGAK